ncbi:MAG: aspartate-semialdehyde dehydrogenase, partial [Crenarchaeota archaeon]|nr:aspartate-semialdehyde dehydrogenase [Thermoproteota archaeon]
MDKLKVIVLGCTGLVGQRFLTLLKDHPMFEVVGLVASERNVGKKYREAVRWVLEEPLPEEFADMELLPPDPDKIPKVDLIFSALPSDVAGKLEIELVKRGQIVVSNASNNRLDPDVPLIVPEINADHLELLKIQRKNRNWPGLLVKNANCTTIILTLSLKPVHDAFTIRRIFVTTMQAVSGAGIGADAVQAVSIIDNIIPYIKKEEDKVQTETRKILGKLENNSVTWAGFNIYATTTRVPVIDGHLESVYVETEKEIDVEELYKEIERFNTSNKISKLNLPTSPPRPIIVRKEPDRPQPRLDRMEGKGMSIVIGRVRKLENNILTYLVLGHNTIRGAAGNTILIAETLTKQMP